jgi:hypothetical protein
MSHSDKVDKGCDRLWNLKSLFDMPSGTYAIFYSPSEHLAVGKVIVLLKERDISSSVLLSVSWVSQSV